MNFPEQDLENLLRRAPQPAPPQDLKAQLLAQVPQSMAQTATPVSTLQAAGAASLNGLSGDRPGTGSRRKSVRNQDLSGWLRRWWPTLIPAAGSLACAAVIAVQQVEINSLRTTIDSLKQQPALPQVATVTQTADTPGVVLPASGDNPFDQEIARLKKIATDLESGIAQLRKVRAENAQLSQQLANRSNPQLPTEDAEFLAKAKERSMSIQCVNNLKQFGLASRVWALDNQDVLPPTILSMSNELSVPKVLICPADKAHQAAQNWAGFTTANTSYEFLAPSATEIEPSRVLSRCPIHGHIGLCDGSVLMGAMTNQPNNFQTRDGKLYFVPQEANPSFSPKRVK